MTEPPPAAPAPAGTPPRAPAPAAEARPVLRGLVVLGDADAEACADGTCG